MKSENFKVLMDKNGNRCRFSPAKFRDALEAVKENSAKEENGKRVYKRILRQRIADQITELIGSEFSREAVDQWEKGYNGPSSFQYVEIAARVLNVGTNAILDRIDEPEEIGFTQAEKDLVFEIYEKCCDLFLEWAEFEPEKASSKSAYAQWEENRKKYEKKLHEVSAIVYRKTLWISNAVQSRLIKMLVEMQCLFVCIPDEWFYFELPYQMTIHYACCEYPTRDEALRELDSMYIFSEMDYCDDLGLEPVVDEKSDELVLQTVAFEELKKYGYQGHHEITPKMVYAHAFPKYLEALFRELFSEAFEN